MSENMAQSRPFPQRLGVRLALAFAITLLPFGIVSGLQSGTLLDEARARSEAALLGETLLAAADESDLIRGARVAAGALAATMEALNNDPAACSAAMRRVQALSGGAYSFVVFVPLSGLAICSSRTEPIDLSDSARLVQMREQPAADILVIRQGVASGTSVLAFGHPAFDSAGAFIGYVSISMPHSVLESKSPPAAENGLMNRLEPIALITFDQEGTVLTSSTGLDDAPLRLPSDRPLSELATNGAKTFVAHTSSGEERVYAVFPLVDGQVFAIGSWPIFVTAGPLTLWISPYFMPALMWLASLLVAMLAAERLVTRHIRALRKSITTFAAGNHRVAGLDLPDAAIEIRDVADAYLKMTDTILHDEAELENTIHQREVLLREVHHRVKNNLQLIASIMNMQMRQSHSHETKTIMRGLQDRIMSLATIHRGLYQTTGLVDVRADELLADILRQILKMSTGPERRFDVTSQFDELHLTPDQAVPLALFLTEALTNAIKYAGMSDKGIPGLAVRLQRDSATSAVLTVRNSVGPISPKQVDATGLGTQLLAAFSQQLGARTEVITQDGFYLQTLHFPIDSLAFAERSEIDTRTAEAQTDSSGPLPA
jgi:two-component system, sensor histidine kinase PdtaS